MARGLTIYMRLDAKYKVQLKRILFNHDELADQIRNDVLKHAKMLSDKGDF
jgi:hypothetical protein